MKKRKMIAVDVSTIRLYDRLDIKETVKVLTSCKDAVSKSENENHYCEAIDVAIEWLQRIEREEIK
jgi:hypothetical protein